MSQDASDNIVDSSSNVLRHIDSLIENNILNSEIENNITNTLRQIVSNNDMVELMTSLMDTNEIPHIIPVERDFRGVENMILMPPPIRNSLLRFMQQSDTPDGITARTINSVLARTLFEKSGVKKVLSEEGFKTLKNDKYNSKIHKNNKCPILRVNFEEGEEITVLPCEHCFNSEAIIHWLKEEKAECPVCRYILDSEEKSKNTEQENQEDQEDQENQEIVQELQNRQTLINSIRRVNLPPIDLEQSREFFREQIRLNHPMWPEEEDMEDLQQAILMSLTDNNN